MASRQYITTAIDYPNAPPHMGHVLEKVLADVCARWMRLRGDRVRFQIGTDEHGVKIQKTADKEGISPQELVDRNVPLFEDLYKRLHISHDVFIRTSDRKTHWPTVIELWRKLIKVKVLEKRTYTGLYCSGCERFLTKKELENGKCPIHKTEPDHVAEENYFFALSKESQWLKKILESEYKIVPDFRAPETFSLIEQGLEDVSFSRPKTSLHWGVPVLDDDEQVMYVWCDALTNYISGLGFFTDHEEREWWDDATVTHVIGKDIARFHALIWPAMLKHADVRIPDRLLIHGFLTSEGEKMSKSLGNVVKPDDVLAKFHGNPDPLRFYLSHEIPVGRDGDFSWDRFEKLYDAKLRNDLGNLLNRVLVMLKKEGGQRIDVKGAEFDQSKETKMRWDTFQNKMDNSDLHEALSVPLELVRYGNACMDQMKPWKAENAEKKIMQLSFLSEVLRQASLMLLPFIPSTAANMLAQLGLEVPKTLEGKTEWGAEKNWKKVGEPSILFAPLDT